MADQIDFKSYSDDKLKKHLIIIKKNISMLKKEVVDSL